MSVYVKPTIVSVVRASKAIAQGLHGSNSATKCGIKQDAVDTILMRSTTGAYQADE
jgi:hypothetical protein